MTRRSEVPGFHITEKGMSSAAGRGHTFLNRILDLVMRYFPYIKNQRLLLSARNKH